MNLLYYDIYLSMLSFDRLNTHLKINQMNTCRHIQDKHSMCNKVNYFWEKLDSKLWHSTFIENHMILYQYTLLLLITVQL